MATTTEKITYLVIFIVVDILLLMNKLVRYKGNNCPG
jgi:hypothetical protein